MAVFSIAVVLGKNSLYDPNTVIGFFLDSSKSLLPAK
jgi:hypothetical protein